MDRESITKATFLHAYDEYADAIFRFCFFRVSDTELASDLMQETYTRVWLYICEGREINNMQAFLYQTARNLITDYFRKKKSSSLDVLIEDGVQFEEHNSVDPSETEIDARYTFEKIQPLLDKLHDSHREVIILRYIEDMGPKEIADILHETENVVSVRLHRGMQKLKTLVETQLLSS